MNDQNYHCSLTPLDGQDLKANAGGWAWVPYVVGAGIIADFAIGVYEGFTEE